MGLPIPAHEENVPGYKHVIQRVTNETGDVKSYTVHQAFKDGKWVPRTQIVVDANALAYETELFDIVLDESAAYRPSLERTSRWQVGRTPEGYPVSTLVEREIEEYTPLKNGNTNRRIITFGFGNGSDCVNMEENIYRKGCKIKRETKALKQGEELLRLDYKSLIKRLRANTSSYCSENLRTGEISEVTKHSRFITREWYKNGESIKHIIQDGRKSVISAIFPDFVFRDNFLQIERGFNIEKLSPRAKEVAKALGKLLLKI